MSHAKAVELAGQGRVRSGGLGRTWFRLVAKDEVYEHQLVLPLILRVNTDQLLRVVDSGMVSTVAVVAIVTVRGFLQLPQVDSFDTAEAKDPVALNQGDGDIRLGVSAILLTALQAASAKVSILAVADDEVTFLYHGCCGVVRSLLSFHCVLLTV